MNEGQNAPFWCWYFVRLLSVLLFAASAPAIAKEAGPKESFMRLNHCVQQNDSESCRNLITASSADIYNRFVSYGIMECLPKDAVYLSQETRGNEVYVRTSATSAGEKRYMRLVFAYEEADWKLDIPESLHAGLGDNWENQLKAIESVYLILHQQMGAQLNCAMIQNLGNKSANTQ